MMKQGEYILSSKFQTKRLKIQDNKLKIKKVS